MNILLVRPGRRKQAITLGEFMFSEPVGLEGISAELKRSHQVNILDLMVDGQDFRAALEKYNPDVVGFTSLCVDVLAVLELARECKSLRPDIVTLAGGTQAFLSPESFFQPEIDHVFEYTTKANLKELFDSLENSGSVPRIDGVRSRQTGFLGTGVQGRNEYLVPDRFSTAKYRQHYSYFGYKPCAIMQTSRGCSSACSFCLRWHLEGAREQDEPLEDVIDQIKEIKEPSIMIYDNNFLYNAARLEQFCDLLESNQIKKNFICYGSAVSITAYPQTVMRLGRNGLQAVLVGYESYSDSELKAYNKKSSVETNLQAAQILKQAGIDCWASFILHPDWDAASFKEFRKYLHKLKPEISSLVPMTPFRGGLLYERYKDRLLFSPEDYDRWSFSVVSIRPGRISLRRYYYEVLKTNLYVNLVLNDPTYMIRKFGFGTLFRILKGSLRFVWTYTKLMVKG